MPINETRKVIQSDILNKYASPIKWEIANVNNYKPEAGELIINSGASEIEDGHPIEPIIKVGDGINKVGALIPIGSKYDLNLYSKDPIDTEDPSDNHFRYYLKKGLPNIAVDVMSIRGNDLITITAASDDPTKLTIDTEIITLENNKSEVNISEKLKVLKSAEIVGNLIVKKYTESEFAINETATSNKHLATGCILAGAGHSISSDQVVCGGNEVIIGQASAATVAVGNNLDISNSPFNAVFGRNNVIKYTSDTIVAGCNNCVSGQEPTEAENAKYVTNSAVFGIRNTSTGNSQLIAGQDNVVESWLGSAIGRHLKVSSTKNNARLAIGQFNADTTHDALFVIGNGNWTTAGSGYSNPKTETGIDGQNTGNITRDNAFVVYYNGSATVGSGHTLSGKSSNFISGWFNQTTNDYETALGKYNRSSDGMIFSIGNGTSTSDDDRSNVFEIHDSQNIIMQNAAISGGNYNFAAGNNAMITTEIYDLAEDARSNVDSLAGNLGDSNFAINAGFIGGIDKKASNGSFAANGGLVLGSGFAAAFNKSTIQKNSYNSFAANNGSIQSAKGSAAFNNSYNFGDSSFTAISGRVHAGAKQSVAIGAGAQVLPGCEYGIAIGYNCKVGYSYIDESNSTQYGDSDTAMALGFGAQAVDVGDVAIGGAKTLAYSSSLYNSYNIAIGAPGTNITSTAGTTNLAMAKGIISGGSDNIAIGKGEVSGGSDNIVIGKGAISSIGHSNILLGTESGACYIRDGSLNIATGKGKVNKGYNTVLMNDAIADDDIGSLAIDAARLNFTQVCFASGSSTIQGVDKDHRVWNAAAFGTGTIVKQTSGSAFGKYNKGEHLFEIGNGNADNDRKNALSVDASGNVEISGTLTVNGVTLSSDQLTKILKFIATISEAEVNLSSDPLPSHEGNLEDEIIESNEENN